jgi:hypothetical protein
VRIRLVTTRAELGAEGLGPVQAMLLQELERKGSLTVLAAGRIIHGRRKGEKHLQEFPAADEQCCPYCTDDGRRVLASLRARRMVKRRRADGLWVLTVPATSAQTSEIPY